IRCNKVELGRRWLLAGPDERVLAGRRGGTGGVETSCLALGLAGAAIDYLHEETANRSDLGAITDRLQQKPAGVRRPVHYFGPTSVHSTRSSRFTGPCEFLGSSRHPGRLDGQQGHGFPSRPLGPAVGEAGALLPGLVLPASSGRGDPRFTHPRG